jgi:hypothetical protein
MLLPVGRCSGTRLDRGQQTTPFENCKTLEGAKLESMSLGLRTLTVQVRFFSGTRTVPLPSEYLCQLEYGSTKVVARCSARISDAYMR